MKKEVIISIREFLINQMSHWILFLIAVTVLGLTESKEPVIWKWIILSLLPFVLFLVRRYTNHFIVFVLSHGIFIFTLRFIPYVDLGEKIAFYVMVIGYICYSFYLRVKTKDRLSGVFHPILTVGIAGGCRFLQQYDGYPEWDKYYLIPIVLFLCLYYIQLYLEQFQHFLVVNESSTGNVPEKAMFHSGISMVSTFSIGTAILLILTSDIGWVGKIASVLREIISFFVRLLFRGEEVRQETMQGEQTTAPMDTSMLEELGTKETSWIWIFLEKVMIIAIVIGAAILLVKSVHSLINYLSERFNTKLSLEEEEGIYVKDVREKCELDRFEKEKRSFFEFLSVKERIRRIYKKEVWTGRWQLAKDGNPSILMRLTPKECGEGLSREKMAKVYEKARYSNEICTAEDIKKAKEK